MVITMLVNKVYKQKMLIKDKQVDLYQQRFEREQLLNKGTKQLNKVIQLKVVE